MSYFVDPRNPFESISSLLMHFFGVYIYSCIAVLRYVLKSMDPSQWSTRSSLTTKGHVSAFWDAIDIWLNKPHVTNRRLCGSDIVFKRHNQLLGRSLEQAGIQIRCAGFTKNDHWDKLLQAVNCSENFNAEGGSTSVIIRDLLPKQLDKIPRVREVILQGKLKMYYSRRRCSPW